MGGGLSCRATSFGPQPSQSSPHLMTQWFSIGQAPLPPFPRGRLALSGDIPGCGNRGAGDAGI